MTITGLVGHIGVGVQASMVTEAQLSSATPFSPTITDYFVVTSESFAAESAPLVAENEIGRGRDRTGAIAGGYGIAGGFGGYARASDLGLLCQIALSDNAAACAPNGTTGLATVVPTDYLDWWSIEKNVGDALYLWLINGKLNNLTISVNQGEIANYTSEWVVTLEKKISSGQAGTPDYTDDDLLAFHGGLIKINGTQYDNMESIEIAIANGLSNDEFTVHPSRFLNNVTEGARTMDLNFNQVFASEDDYEKYNYGETDRETPGYSLFEDDVEFTLMNAQTIAAASEYIKFTFPRVMFGGLPVTLATGRVVVSNTGIVLAPSVGNIITVEYK
jgi:hypothetical protein